MQNSNSKVEPTTESGNSTKLPVSRQFTCDCCEETWEENFMCEKCSGLQEIGFKRTDSYKHDHYHTNRYKLGCLEVEFTYENKQLLTCDLTISELNCMPISFNQIKQIAELLGHWSD